MQPDFLDNLENAVNEVSDKDWSWYPFLWLRPEPHERMSLPRLATMALLYGLPFGALMAIAISFADPSRRASAPMFIAAFPLMLFFVASVFVGPMWNRRADRLKPVPVRERRG